MECNKQFFNSNKTLFEAREKGMMFMSRALVCGNCLHNEECLKILS